MYAEAAPLHSDSRPVIWQQELRGDGLATGDWLRAGRERSEVQRPSCEFGLLLPRTTQVLSEMRVRLFNDVCQQHTLKSAEWQVSCQRRQGGAQGNRCIDVNTDIRRLYRYEQRHSTAVLI